jgi:protein-tyrosine phosphatase
MAPAWSLPPLAPVCNRRSASAADGSAYLEPVDARRRDQEAALGLSWLSPALAVGGRIADDALPLLRELGLQHVIDVRDAPQDDALLLQRHGLQLLLLPTQDHHALAPDMLARGVDWALARLRAGQRVYIHCEHGIGRSVLLAWCVLVALGETPRQALVRIKAARAVASPSPAQIHALLDFARQHVEELPSWDALAAIAYENIRAAEGER